MRSPSPRAKSYQLSKSPNKPSKIHPNYKDNNTKNG